jgi:UDP-N-acetyl-2-amino-2-deoxyglucuronate dehydrogenase
LHTRSYEEILKGNGFRIGLARKAIETVYDIRHKTPIGLVGDYHPLAKISLAKHPFNRS